MIRDVLLAVLFVGGTIALTLGSYLAMRLFTGGDPNGRDRELAGSVLARVAALHTLILALVFAQEMVEFQQLRSESATEANAIADIYNDARRYDPTTGQPIRLAIADYLDLVIDKEWAVLAASGRLSPEAWSSWTNAYQAVLDLPVATERQKSLRDHMLASVHQISEQRIRRESTSQDELTSLFWFAAIAGVVFSALAYYPYPPDRRNLVLLSVFGAFTGIVLFMIFALSNAYNPPGALQPGAFERLRQSIASAPP